jgi:lysophospholipase L1-like esterase
MSVAERNSYLSDVTVVMRAHWPENRLVNIICHGHSVPAGYFATPMVDTFNAYPHLLHRGLKQRFPFAVINVIVTAIGGETSESGSKRFEDEALCHRPDVLTIDYGLNDRVIGLEKAKACWQQMIERALRRRAKIILLTPTPDATQFPNYAGADKENLPRHADQIRRLAEHYEVGLADSFSMFRAYWETGDPWNLMSQSNHPNRGGHEIVARELLRWFPADEGAAPDATNLAKG